MLELLLLLLTVQLPQAAGPAATGRIVVRLGEAKVSPTSVQINGPRSSRRDLSGHEPVTFDDLPPGSYDVQGFYEAGIGGEHQTVVVESGKSTTLTVGAENVGAVELNAVSETCADTFGFGIDRMPAVNGPPILAADRSVAHFQKRMSGCAGVAAGLAPGVYLAYYSGIGGDRLSIARFTVIAQQITTVLVGPPAVRLTGRVTYNERPPARAAVQLMSLRDPAGLPSSAAIDPDGRYTMTLPQSGPDSMQLVLDGSYTLLTTIVQLSNGTNAFDWPVTGGSVVISLAGWNRVTSMDIWVEGAGNKVTTLGASSPYPFKIEGLPLGTFKISAREVPARLSSRAAAVVDLDAAHPDVPVQLTLVANSGTIALRDDAGAAMAGGSVFGAFDARATETAPGIFSLRGLPLGVPLQVGAPGFVPACAQSRGEAQIITLLRGRSVDIVFAGIKSSASSTTPPGSLVIGQGADACVVLLTRFAFRQITTAHGTPVRFRFDNFPDVDSFAWRSQITHQDVIVPATGPIVIK